MKSHTITQSNIPLIGSIIIFLSFISIVGTNLVIAGIKNNIRNHDFVARLGGDEFLIIFEGLNERKSEEIWERIIKEYNEVNDTKNRSKNARDN